MIDITCYAPFVPTYVLLRANIRQLAESPCFSFCRLMCSDTQTHSEGEAQCPHITHVYFPNRGAVSIVSVFADDGSVNSECLLNQEKAL